ncbi:NAD(P)H-binding protein, partial [Vibrio parahaemolyticus]
MTTVVLGATGGTGRQLVARALASRLDVRALVRNPATADLPVHPRLQVVRADVHDAASVTGAIDAED